jgi:hypothetical protein
MFEALKLYCSKFSYVVIPGKKKSSRTSTKGEYTQAIKGKSHERNAAALFRRSGLSENLYWLHERRKRRKTRTRKCCGDKNKYFDIEIGSEKEENIKMGKLEGTKVIPQAPATIRKQQLASRNELLSGEISTLLNCAKIKIKGIEREGRRRR